MAARKVLSLKEVVSDICKSHSEVYARKGGENALPRHFQGYFKWACPIASLMKQKLKMDIIESIFATVLAAGSGHTNPRAIQ